MSQATAQRAANANEEEAQQPGNRPALKYRHGGIELAVWPNQTENGLMYNTDNKQQLQRRQDGRVEAHQQLQSHRSAGS